MDSHNKAPLRLFGVLQFVAIVAVFILFGALAFYRVLGVIVIIQGIFTLRSKSVAVGWRGYEPSFHLKGASALTVGIVAIVLGCLLIVFTPEAVCIFSKGLSCP